MTSIHDSRPPVGAAAGAGSDHGSLSGPEVSPPWTVRDRNGLQVAAWSTRAGAVRHLGTAALKGASLPLSIYNPDGAPSGDRLG